VGVVREVAPSEATKIRGDTLVLAATAVFGTYPLFFRTFGTVPTIAWMAAAQIVGALVLFRAIWRKPLPDRVTTLLLLGMVASGLVNDGLMFSALRMTTVANAQVAHLSVSLFLLVLSPLLLGIGVRPKEWVALGVSLAGIAILYSDGTVLGDARDMLGLTLGVLSGFFYALLIILYVRLSRRGAAVRQVNSWRFLVGGVVITPIMLFADLGSITATDVLPLVAFGLVSAVIATGLHTLGMTRTRPLHASILGKTEPVFATVYALLFLNEGLTREVVLGGVLIIGSSVWLTVSRSSEET
jgi:drug/metabolite transporter (DMT)-like permease